MKPNYELRTAAGRQNVFRSVFRKKQNSPPRGPCGDWCEGGKRDRRNRRKQRLNLCGAAMTSRIDEEDSTLADVHGDGDRDLLMGVLGAPCRLWRNSSSER